MQTFIIDHNDKKNKELRKKTELSYTFKEPWSWPIFPFLGGKTFFSKILAMSCTTPHEPLTPC